MEVESGRLACVFHFQVSKLVYEQMRPVLILGPLSEVIVERLLQNHPDKYAKCVPVQSRSAGVDEGDVIESRQFSGMLELVTGKAVRDVAENNMHCVVSFFGTRLINRVFSPINFQSQLC